MPAGEDGGSTRAGDTLSVRCRIFDWVEEGRPDLIVGCRVSGATPVDLNWSDVAVMFKDERLQSVGHRISGMEDIEEPAADRGG